MIFHRFLAWVLAAFAFCCVADRSHANSIMDWVDVRDPGNPENTFTKRDGTSGYGAVDYKYRIGKYEVTNQQYVEFLNSVATTDSNSLYDFRMSSKTEGGISQSGSSGSYSYSVKPNMGNKPVNYVSWYDAARFANWFQNGQPTGMQDSSTTEDGAYTFSGPYSVSGRNRGAQFFLPTEHEWEKAAFYEPGADTMTGDGWWFYPSHSDEYPEFATADEFGDVTNPGPHVVVGRKFSNWNGTTNGNVVTVGSAGNESYYGARDMTGNVFEWVLADPSKPDPNGWGPYAVRGGSYINYGHIDNAERNLVHHDNHAVVAPTVGFRLAAASLDPFSADFDGDTIVNNLDLETWQQAYGNSIAGDANNDGKTDGSDFLLWQRQFVSGTLQHVQIPEPASLVLIAGFLMSTWVLRRK